MKKSISNKNGLLRKLNTEFVTRYVKTDSAITLVALVVTIIILLILTAVTLNLITGTDGIIDKAVAALIATDSAEAREQAELFFSDCKAGYFEERYIDKNNVPATVPDYYRDQVGEKGRPIGDGYYVTMDDDDNVYIYSGSTEDAVI